MMNASSKHLIQSSKCSLDKLRLRCLLVQKLGVDIYGTYKMSLRHTFSTNFVLDLHLPFFPQMCNMRVHILHTW